MNRNKKLIIITITAFVLLLLHATGYLSLEEKGMCKVQTPQVDQGKMIIGSTTSQSIITQTDCEKSCQSFNQYDTVATCEFEGNFGTDWVKTSEDFPITDVFGIK
jgi:hypothetical protein